MLPLVPCRSITSCAWLFNYTHSCPSDLCLDICSHVSLRHDVNSCGPLPPIIWQYRQLLCSPQGRCVASRLRRSRKLWCFGLIPAVSVFHWLASASEKLPLRRLGITVSISPWCASALASDSPSRDSDTNCILVTYFHVRSFRSIIAFYQQCTFYIRWFMYGILVPVLPRHCLGLPLPRLEH